MAVTTITSKQHEVVVPAKFISGRHPVLIWALRSSPTKDSRQLRQQARYTRCRKQAQEKAEAFLVDPSLLTPTEN